MYLGRGENRLEATDLEAGSEGASGTINGVLVQGQDGPSITTLLHWTVDLVLSSQGNWPDYNLEPVEGNQNTASGP